VIPYLLIYNSNLLNRRKGIKMSLEIKHVCNQCGSTILEDNTSAPIHYQSFLKDSLVTEGRPPLTVDIRVISRHSETEVCRRCAIRAIGAFLVELAQREADGNTK
jgi:hypothetical protein